MDEKMRMDKEISGALSGECLVIFGGTVEGRRLAETFSTSRIMVHVCVATQYGASLLPKSPNIQAHVGRMEAEEMADFLAKTGAVCCVDATHPYAAVVTENIERACQRIKLPCIRVQRREEEISVEGGSGQVQVVTRGSVEEAAAFLKDTTGNILITTGSKELEKFSCIPDYQSRCFARVLPTVPVMEKCRELGFEGRNLIGMQGPFSEELNYWMLKQVDASWMVTKSSGRAGGYQEKCEAAIRAGVNILIVERPKEAAGQAAGGVLAADNALISVMELQEAIAFLREKLHIPEKKKVWLIGMGPGDPENLTKEAIRCLERSDLLAGAGRILEIWPGFRKKPFLQSYQKKEIASWLRANKEWQEASIVYSGDIGFYSGAKGMGEELKEFEVHPVAGIASPLYFLDRLGVPWEKVRLVSGHGQDISLIPLIREQEKVCVLLDNRSLVQDTCKKLIAYSMEQVKITVGERLSYPRERITAGYPKELMEQEWDPLSIALFENPHGKGKPAVGIEDSCFIRGRVPMTKKEIRILSLAALKLAEDSIVYDIGAGTGSVSIEAALQCSQGMVYALEKNPEAVSLIRENQIAFQADNLLILQGEAPDCMEGLPIPTHVFIGGSGGRLLETVQRIHEKNPAARFVINAITLETMEQVLEIRRRFPEYADMEITQINVARSRELSRYHLMEANNPVFIISFGGRSAEAGREEKK